MVIRIWKWLLTIMLVLMVPALWYLASVLSSYFQGEDLMSHDKAVSTVYIFHFEKGEDIVIKDPHSNIVRSWGGRPTSRIINNGCRLIVFSEVAILKTNVDSIEPRESSVRIKGYMGDVVGDKMFTVDVDGYIFVNN